MTEAPTPTAYTIFMLVKATEAWLALSPPDRFAFVRAEIQPRLREQPGVSLRYFDTEFFNSEVSDVMVWETRDLDAYRALIEGLRETQFWDHYFRVVSILPGVENAYAAHYEVETLSG